MKEKKILFYCSLEIPSCFKEEIKIKALKLLFDYANRQKILVDVNTIGYKEYTPLLSAEMYIFDRSTSFKFIKMIFDYANGHKIIINIIDTDVDGTNSILHAISINSTILTKFIFKYANKHKIKIDLNQKKKNKYGKFQLINAIENKNIDIITILKLRMKIIHSLKLFTTIMEIKK